jgi:hypothetical protein
MIPLWKGKNPIYFGVITIIPFDNLYRRSRAYFVMHTFLVFMYKNVAGFDINFLTNLSIRASANLFYLPETVNY